MFEKPEAEIVDNYLLDTLYVHEFKNGSGKFFTIVSCDSNNVPDVVEYTHPYPIQRNKIKTTFAFVKDKDEITQIKLQRFKYYAKKGWMPQEEKIAFSYDYFKQIIGYFLLLSELKLSEISERRISLANDTLLTIDEDTKKRIKTLLLRPDGQKIIKELIDSGIITSSDIVNIGYRKKQLEIFEKLLKQPGYVSDYANHNDLVDKRPEPVWQHFFQNNDWIFGYGLDYRFLGILQKEIHLAATDLTGKDGAIGDFLLGCSDFTVLVEIKKPDTELFGNDKNRANSWMLSPDLISGVSQILEQKASWQIFAESNATKNFTDKGNLISQKAYDPKSILIIGSKTQFEGEDKENIIKAKTFELFRRDSRNIEIITYDELFERAKFIVSHSQKK